MSRGRRVAGTVITAGLAAAAARVLYAALARRPPGGTATWTRTNHRGEPVSLLAGPALAAAAVAASAAAPGLAGRTRAALVTAGAGAAAVGGYDDLAGRGDRRGFRGHLGALARGEVTTGAVKLAGIGATGLTAAALAGGAPADVIINAGLAAGGANLVNLFDLRPGRAIKVALAGAVLLATAAPGAAGPAVAGPAGAAAALLPDDLAERVMIGDAGANCLGAMLGVAAASLSRPARVALLAAIAGLTAASEVISFTAVIERTPALRRLDMLGRRPPGPGLARAGPGGNGAAGNGPAGDGPAGNGPASADPAAGQPGPGRAEVPTAIEP
jgi:UDP-N-acetylmuramyl pentapeptide phosphotransferase/UDP-N-acetylglucosamine-1-phosphate transferase